MAPAPPAVDVDAHTRAVSIGAGTFPVLDHGEGPAIVLLHGFPDSRRLWRRQVPALASTGRRVIAPDMRGFGDAPRPGTVEAYEIEHPRDDVLAILDELDVERCCLVGHDWGADVAWRIAADAPSVVERLGLLSVGPARATSIDAWERSWYRWFFQFEAAEAWLRHDDWALFRAWLRESGDFDRYLEDLRRSGALTAALNWYRANIDPSPPTSPPSSGTVSGPVLGVWSDGDHHLAEAQMTETEAMVEGPWRYERISDASHWLMLDRPELVNEILTSFLEE